MHRTLVASLLVCSATANAAPADEPLVVAPAWLAAHARDANLVLLHVGDAAEYKAGHIPGARFVDISKISVGVHDGTGLMLELPPADDLRKGLEQLGISDDSRVVVYFGKDWVSPSTRVIFTLDAAGLGARTSLLDGGMPAWVRAGQKTTADAPPTKAGKLSPFKLRPLVADASTVLASLGKPGVAVIDARAKEFYDGEKAGDSHGKAHAAGHIAGARNLPYDTVVDERNELRSAEDLAARFAAAGVKKGDKVIAYCHIGQQATAVVFAARRAGITAVLYDGSYEDWSVFHPKYPVEKTKAAK